jgi:predicted transcriptional regulator
MTTITISDAVAARLEQRAAARGVSVEALLVELAEGLVDHKDAAGRDAVDDGLFDAFVNSGRSGDTRDVSFDVLRRERADQLAD